MPIMLYGKVTRSIFLAALCGFFALSGEVLAAVSDSFSSFQDNVGIVEFNSSSLNYDFKAEVGRPGAGKSVSQNYILDQEIYWGLDQVAVDEPAVSTDSGDLPVVQLPVTEPESDIPVVPPAESGTNEGTRGTSPASGGTAVVSLSKERMDSFEPGIIGSLERVLRPKTIGPQSEALASSYRKADVVVATAGTVSVFILMTQAVNVGHLVSAVRSVSDFWLIILKLWYAISSLFGLRRKPKYWGTVYDSRTKQPLDPVMVHLIDVATGAVVQQAITDMAGRYGFMAKSGKYRIMATKTHFAFPSRTITGDKDEIFDHLYHGETIEVTEETGLVAPNIPMDQLAYDWNQEDKKRLIKFHPKWELALNAASLSILWSGLFALLFVILARPTVLHAVFLAAYLVVVFLHYYLPNPRLWGRVYDSKTHAFLAGLVFELSPKGLSRAIYRAKSSEDGKFFLKCLPGQYDLTIKRPDAAGRMLVLKTMPVSVGKNGMLAQDLAV